MEGLTEKPPRGLPVSLLLGVAGVPALLVAGGAYVWSASIALDGLLMSVSVGLLWIGFSSAFTLGYESYRLGRLQQQTQEQADRLAATLEQMRTSQQALIEAERLAVARQMGVTIQHEINNPLTAVLGNAEWLIESEKEVSHEGVRALGEMRRAAIRIRDVVRRLDEIEVVRTTSFLGDIRMIDLGKTNEASENQGQPSRR